MSDTSGGTRRPDDLTVAQAIVTAARQLAAAGVASPRVDAELLAAHVLGISRGALAGCDAVVPRERFLSLVRRRADREPLQHLTGTAGFHRIELTVGPGVFVPRPETELLVEWGLSVLREPRPLVVDLCAGSGAVALAVAAARPDATVYAVESDPAALHWLHRNAAAQRDRAVSAGSADYPVAASGGSVTVVAGDAVAAQTLAGLDGRVDLVLANPPYVPAGAEMPPEVAGFDPDRALYAGPDGLAVIRPLVARAASLLRPGGRCGVEHDDSHAEAVPDLFTVGDAWTGIADHRDLAGRPRFTTARRRGRPPPQDRCSGCGNTS